jgi:magnesium-protoporphyrin O-methyltransferase
MHTSSHQDQLQTYFNGVGFERWAAIYGQGPLSRIRRTIREGHTRMLAQAEAWLTERGTPGALLDAGCGTGLFSIAMAQRGWRVTALDLAPRMVAAARHAAQQAGVTDRITFVEGDLEAAAGQFTAVACFDVLVHYPQPTFAQLCTHLARHAMGSLLLTYAPYNRLLAALHWVGGRFPKGQRRTEIQMIPAATVATILADAGLKVRRSRNISHGFYHVTLIEAVRTDSQRAHG